MKPKIFENFPEIQARTSHLTHMKTYVRPPQANRVHTTKKSFNNSPDFFSPTQIHFFHDIFDLVLLNNISNAPKSGFFTTLTQNFVLEPFWSEFHLKSGPKTYQNQVLRAACGFSHVPPIFAFYTLKCTGSLQRIRTAHPKM